MPILNKYLSMVAALRPHDPVDALARYLFEESDTEQFEEIIGSHFNPIHWFVRALFIDFYMAENLK